MVIKLKEWHCYSIWKDKFQNLQNSQDSTEFFFVVLSMFGIPDF